jgi:hypothetical protein
MMAQRFECGGGRPARRWAGGGAGPHTLKSPPASESGAVRGQAEDDRQRDSVRVLQRCKNADVVSHCFAG